MKKAFFLFPGQGAQYPGMALDLLQASLESSSKSGGEERVKKLFSLASEIYGKDMAALLGSIDADTLKRTDMSQPLITLTNLAAAAYLAEKGITPSGCAGFSLGEYAALTVSGVISEADCMGLVIQRGKSMQKAASQMEAAGKEGGGNNIPGMAAWWVLRLKR